MSSQLKSASEFAVGLTSLNSTRDATEGQSLDSLADPVRFVAVARKNKPLWLKVHPLTLSLLGLALAVVLWGLEYKVSLYHPHPKHSARVGVAKLWVGPRKAVFTKSSRLKWHAPSAPELQLLTSRHVSASDWVRCASCCEAELILPTGFLSRHGTPRAPPSI